MKRILCICFCILNLHWLIAQENDARIQQIRNQIEALSVDNEGFSENVKTEVSLSQITLSNFLVAIAELHHLNFNVSPELNQITLVNNFTNVTVTDLLVYLCKEYRLNIDFTGNILSIRTFNPELPQPQPKVIPISYYKETDLISMDIKHDMLYDVFRKVMDVSGNNLFFPAELENYPLTTYMVQVPFETAMKKLAFENNLYVEKNREGFYVFGPSGADANAQTGSPNSTNTAQMPVKRRLGNFYFKVLDKDTKLLDVDFTDTPIASIVYDIGNELGIDMFIASPLEEAGRTTFKATGITFDRLLTKVFESQITSGTPNPNAQPSGNRTNTASESLFSYKQEENVYYFGKIEQLSVRNVEVVQLLHRSIQMLTDPTGNIDNMTTNNRTNYNGANGQYGNNSRNYNNRYGNTNTTNQTTAATNNVASQNQIPLEDLTSIIPEDIMKGLTIKTDYELNCFYVSGPSKGIERFRDFMQEIDKPVPVVLIEVMMLEVNRKSSIDTGVSWGIGDEPSTTSGELFPSANLTLGASTINKVIGGFDGFGSFNLGKVVPNFYMTIKAMEENGNIKIRTAPKLATLNGHTAVFTNGNSTYYAVTDRYVYGNDNPQTSVITNYVQIDVGLGLYIKPYVSGDGEVTLDMKVVQSDFGSRISDEAPPDINSREFSSIIRVKDQDIVVLGGLEINSKNDSGSGVPFLARIPVIKWLFSRRVRSDSKSKLSVLIKPTVIN